MTWTSVAGAAPTSFSRLTARTGAVSSASPRVSPELWAGVGRSGEPTGVCGCERNHLVTVSPA